MEMEEDVEDEEMGEETEEEEADEFDRLRELQEQMEILEEEVMKLRDEADARKTLEVSEEERVEREKEILEAVGREYTLARKGTLSFDYSLGYSYSSYDVLESLQKVEHTSNHSLRSSIAVGYASRDNFRLSVSIPFVYKWDNVGTTSAREVHDLGDVSFGFQWQPLKSGGELPTTILSGGLSVPLGRSPYEIMVDKDLATGVGFYSTNLGISFSRRLDPIMAFGNIGYAYNLEVRDIAQKRSGGRILEGVDPGSSLGFGVGMGYALSYKVSLNMSFNYSYGFVTKYHWKGAATTDSGTSVSSSISIGTGWRLTPERSISFGVGIPLTSGGGFSVSLRIPFEFQRGRK
jgi:hypothetical protein